MKKKYYPIIALFVMQLLPNVSFVGHLSGLLLGYLFVLAKDLYQVKLDNVLSIESSR
jgi:hypothetical protein